VYFRDGTKCPIFEDARGQFDLDDDGNGIDGVWYISRDKCPQLVAEPLMVREN
jgi:hypothetical protein